MTEKKENRGGKRENAGRPKESKTISVKVKKKILNAARKLAKQHGKSIEEAMLEMIYDKNIQDTVKASVFKTYLDAMVAKTSESTLRTVDETPKIYLPKRNEDPALRVVAGGK